VNKNTRLGFCRIRLERRLWQRGADFIKRSCLLRVKNLRKIQ
jgi:hypothetical protein